MFAIVSILHTRTNIQSSLFVGYGIECFRQRHIELVHLVLMYFCQSEAITLFLKIVQNLVLCLQQVLI